MPSRKGRPNKLTAQIKENVVAVFNKLGGTAEMAAWAKDNKTAFYRTYMQLMPREVHAEITYTDETRLTDAELAAIATGSSEGNSETETGPPESTGVH